MYGDVIDQVDTVITGPVQPPMTVDFARRHIRAISHEDDVLIATWIQAAAQFLERYTGRDLITTVREVWMDAFPSPWASWHLFSTVPRIELPNPPLQSVNSVLYIDGDGNLASFDDGNSPAVVSWQVKNPQGPYARRGYLEPLYGLSWPTARCESGAVRIQYVSGYGDTPDDIPELVTGALAYLVGTFDQNRSPEAFRTGFADFPIATMKPLLDELKYSALPSTRPRLARPLLSGWWR